MLTNDGRVQYCEWYIMCDHVAVALVSHPVLAPVPICQRCINRHDLSDRIVQPGV